MIDLDRTTFGMTTRTIWLSERPYDIDNVDSVCFLACREKIDLEGFAREDRSTIMIDLTNGAEGVWNGMNGKCRSAIKKAEKEDLKISVNDEQEGFAKLNAAFRSSKNLSEHDFPPDFIRKNGTVFTAKDDQGLIAGILFLADQSGMLGVLSASRRLDADKDERARIANVNRLLWWEAIRHGEEEGLGFIDMGGYYTGSAPNPELEGVNEFKRRFGGTIVGSHIYKKDYTRKIKLARTIGSYLPRSLLGRIGSGRKAAP